MGRTDFRDIFRNRHVNIAGVGVVSTLGAAPSFVLCGDNPLVYQMAIRLTEQFVDAAVTAVVPNRDASWYAGLEQVRGVRILVSPRLDEPTLQEAEVAQAQAMALLDQADVDNLRTALRVHEINPDIRLVIRMFNTGLGFRIRMLFDDCVVLSISEMVAPSFVAAALGEPARSCVQLTERMLYVAPADDVGTGTVVCGVREDSGGIELVAAGESADAAVAVSEGFVYLPPRKRRPWLRAVRYLARNHLIRSLAALLLVITGCCFLLALTVGKHWGDAIYETLIDTAGGVTPEPGDLPFRTLQLVITFAGLAITPVVTALIVSGVLWTQMAVVPTGDPARYENHVVVVGLGNVGMRIMEQLKDLGVAVVGLDRDENARGMAVARTRGVPVVIGQATWEDSLRAAGVPKARALVLVTSSDAVNLETAFLGRACSDTVRVVMRLSDDELAERVQRKMAWAVVRGVFQLSADGFAAALAHRRVTGTLPLLRHTLMAAEIPIGVGSALAGQPIVTAELPGRTRVIAVQKSVGTQREWWPDPTRPFAVGNQVAVVATNDGLRALLGLSVGTDTADGPRPERGPGCPDSA